MESRVLLSSSSCRPMCHVVLVVLVAVVLVLPAACAQTYQGVWLSERFGGCLEGCGVRYTSRYVDCVTRDQTTLLEEDQCDPALKPPTSMLCDSVDCQPAVVYGAFGFCDKCEHIRPQQCVQKLGNDTEVTVALSLCNLTAASDTQVCGLHLCRPVWQAHAFNCCDASAALGRRCYDELSNEVVEDAACLFRAVELNLTEPAPAECVQGVCPYSTAAPTHAPSPQSHPPTSSEPTSSEPTSSEPTSSEPTSPRLGDTSYSEVSPSPGNGLSDAELRGSSAVAVHSCALLVTMAMLTVCLPHWTR